MNTYKAKVFFFYTIIIALFLGLSLYFKILVNDEVNHLLVKRIFLVVEFGLLSTFYFHALLCKWKKSFLVFANIIFILFSIYDFVATQDPTSFSFVPLVFECFFFATLIIFFFYEKIKYNISTPILNSSEFWISVAFFIYFSGNFFLFLFSKTMLKDSAFRPQYIIIYGSVTIIKDILLCLAILIGTFTKEDRLHFKKYVIVDSGNANAITNNPNL